MTDVESMIPKQQYDRDFGDFDGEQEGDCWLRAEEAGWRGTCNHCPNDMDDHYCPDCAGTATEDEKDVD